MSIGPEDRCEAPVAPMAKLAAHTARNSRPARGLTLVEVVISLSIAAFAVAAIIQGYVLAGQRAEWSAYSLAAQSLALQRMEQARACKWDTETGTDELVQSNFPPQVNILDIPSSATNYVYATNFATVTMVSANPLLKQIRIDCVWSFRGKALYTNSIQTYRSPDD